MSFSIAVQKLYDPKTQITTTIIESCDPVVFPQTTTGGMRMPPTPC